MTKREALQAIVNGNTEAMNDAIEWARTELEKMDAANEKRRNTMSKTAKANKPIIDDIVGNILSDEPMTAKDIAEATAETYGLSVQKASALMRTAVKEGIAEVEDVKVKGKGTQKGYTKAKEYAEA